MGGSLMVHLSALSPTIYQELTPGQSELTATQLFYDIACKIYVKMGRLSWWFAKWGNYCIDNYLLKITNLFRTFLLTVHLTYSTKSKSKEIKGTETYICPMHYEIKFDKPGKCPKCGIDMVEKK